MRNDLIGGVFVTLSFVVRFSVFELLLILYFTVVNSDLGLRRTVAGKHFACFPAKAKYFALRNIPLTLTCSEYGVNPEASGAWDWSPRWEMRGGNPAANFFSSNFCSILQKNDHI